MPVSSQAQWRYMGAVASGKAKSKGLSREEARKMLHESRGTYGKLPRMAINNIDSDKEGAGDKDSPTVSRAEYGMRGKFGKSTNARVPSKGKGPGSKPGKGKKMSKAEFLKMVREKKFAKKKK